MVSTPISLLNVWVFVFQRSIDTFQTKEAVVATLAEQLIADWDTWFDHLYEGDEACEDIETAWCESVDLFYESIQKRVGGVAVRHAMKMSPALQEMEQADGEYLVGRLIDSLQRYIPQLKTSDARRAAVFADGIGRADHGRSTSDSFENRTSVVGRDEKDACGVLEITPVELVYEEKKSVI